jgi:uncharacterized protein YegL
MATAEKIQKLNFAVQNALPHMVRAAQQNPFAAVVMHVVRFSSGAHWVSTDEEGCPLESFVWKDLAVVPRGPTDTGAAIGLTLDALDGMEDSRLLPPVLALVADGDVTDTTAYSDALRRLDNHPVGGKSVRVAIAVGKDAKLDTLTEFTRNPRQVFEVHNGHALVECIRWISTGLLVQVSSPRSHVGAEPPAPSSSGSTPAPAAATGDPNVGFSLPNFNVGPGDW